MLKHRSHKKDSLNRRNAKIIGFLIACICVCLAFVGGFILRGETAFLKSIGFSSMVSDVEENPGATVTGNTYDSISARVAEIEGLLKNESLDDYELDAATQELLNAFSEVTDDPYLRYYTSDRYATYVQENAGKHAGIGALFSEKGGSAYVVDIFPESSAEKAGVQVGDFVVAIDGDRSQLWTQTEVINALSRDEGESVVVTWRRPATLDAAGGEEFITTLRCSEYSEQNVKAELHEKVGYITLKQLTQDASSLVLEAIEDLTTQGAESFVLDIRDNPGGYLTQAVETASLFVKSGVIVGIETKEEHDTTKSATGSAVTDAPLVVIVNANTTAAAEVLAAALKDNDRATIVGKTTLGKGSVQVVKPLSFGGALRYTAAYYKSPLGYEINGVGVVPHISVDASLEPEVDNQKSFAIEIAQSRTPEE